MSVDEDQMSVEILDPDNHRKEFEVIRIPRGPLEQFLRLQG